LILRKLADISTTVIKKNLTIFVVTRILSLAWQEAEKTEMAKAKKQQKPRTTATGEWLYCNFSARPQEIANWKAYAASEQRSLSSWIRDVLMKEVARRKEDQFYEYDRTKPLRETSNVGVAAISPDRPRSDDPA
jgi:hypothetical protein